MNRNRRPAARNACIWRKATPAEVEASKARAAIVHEHHYYNHPTIVSHMACDCGWRVRRDTVPADLIFSGPNKVKGK